MKKDMRKVMHSTCAAAMALTLAIPVSAGMKMNVVAAADEDSILSKALVTYDFEAGEDALELEGEEYLSLVDSGEKDASGNAVMVPEIADGEYVRLQSDALPTVVEDGQKGNVLRFKDSVKVDQYMKAVSDELDDEYAIGECLQTAEKIGGRVHLENPYKEMDLDGVTISYWVMAPTVLCDEDPASNNKGGLEIGANSTTVVFNNYSREVIQKDDYMKYLACKAYDTMLASQITPALRIDEVYLIPGVEETKVTWDDFSQGTQEIVTDSNGNKYVLYSDYGKLVRFSPEYPVTEVDGVKADMSGGWYYPDKESDRKVDVTKADGKTTIKIASFATGSTPDTAQYELFRYRYAANEAADASGSAAEIQEAEAALNAEGFSSKSKLRDGVIQGSMQITTDNDFGFREDSYRTESTTTTDENGKEVVSQKAIAGYKVTNPNSAEFGKLQDFYGANQFYFDGDEFVTQGKEDEDTVYFDEFKEDVDRPAIQGADKWHYVTIVIENDWVQTYVDGVPANVEEAGDYTYLKDSKNITDHEFSGKSKNTGKGFNHGKGLRGIFAMEDNISDWTSYGTASNSPANAAAITMLEWLADNNTELYLGGTGVASGMITQSYGTVDGVCMDDVSFFDYAMDMDDAVALYNEVRGAMASKGDLDGNGDVDSDDAVIVLRHFAGLEELTGSLFDAADIDGNGDVDSDDAVLILKYFAGLIDDADW